MEKQSKRKKVPRNLNAKAFYDKIHGKIKQQFDAFLSGEDIPSIADHFPQSTNEPKRKRTRITNEQDEEEDDESAGFEFGTFDNSSSNQNTNNRPTAKVYTGTLPAGSESSSDEDTPLLIPVVKPKKVKPPKADKYLNTMIAIVCPLCFKPKFIYITNVFLNCIGRVFSKWSRMEYEIQAICVCCCFNINS